MAACWTNGITAGTSDTTYGGSESVTTAQAALMLMKALGYFQYSSDFGSDWQLSTISQGNKIDLFENVDSGVQQAMTRNDLAQLVLNTLEAGTVEAESDGSFQIGDISFASNVTYKYVTSGRDYAYAINDRLDTNNDGSYSSGAIVELGEKLYNGDLTKEENGRDDFGRPANIWEYQANEIGTFADSETYTFTSKVTSKICMTPLAAPPWITPPGTSLWTARKWTTPATTWMTTRAMTMATSWRRPASICPTCGMRLPPATAC